ncbi:MAG: hypothetical protein C4293_20975 [Nitrospiraceae bacterium]
MIRFRLVVTILLGLVVFTGSDPGRAIMYRCTDRSGASVYTDSLAQLQECVAVAEGSPASTPSPSSPSAHPSSALPAEGGEENVKGIEARALNQVTIPVQRAGHLLVVQTQLNHNREVRLILDTGATHTILSHEVARDLGILADGRVGTVTLKTAGGPVQAELIRVNTIRLGDAEVRDVPAAVHDIPDVPPGVDGLLGLTFLNQFLVTLDIQRGELHLKRRN